MTQDLLIGLLLGYVLRTAIYHLISRGRGLLAMQEAEMASLYMLEDANIMFKRANKWSSIVAESLEEVPKDVRARLLTQFSEEEVEEITEEWDLSFREHNAEVWSKSQEACSKWRELGLANIRNRLNGSGYRIEWNNWDTAMKFLRKEEDK